MLDEGLRFGRGDDHDPGWKNEDDGPGDIGGEEPIATEPFAVKQPGE
jgi:hypothetical protein